MISSALAEAAAASTRTEIRPALIFSLVFNLYFLITGIASLITKKYYGSYARFIGRYTDESVEKFLRPYGISQTLIGAGMATFQVPYVFFGINSIALAVVGAVIAIAGIVILFVYQKKYLVRKF